LLHFVRATANEQSVLTKVTAVALINYKASLENINIWYLGALAGVLKKWHRLGYAGVDSDAVLLVKQLRLKGNAKGVAVLTMDPNDGPFSYIELEALQSALNGAYAEGEVDTEEFTLAWLYMLLGQRNTQHSALKVCDVRVAYNAEHEPTYSIMVPRAKQGSRNPRDEFTERPLIEQFGEVLLAYAEAVKREFASMLEDASQAPLFPSRFGSRWSKGYEFHHSAKMIGSMLSKTLQRLRVKSERTGGLLKIIPIRFRRTIGTRAAEEGYGPLVIAKLLDHTDTQNVLVYSANSSAIIERIDRAMAVFMAPLAQAFAGVVADGRDGAYDPSKRIIDFRIDRSGNPMGKCGQHSFCGFSAPIACYTCKSFVAWLDGPHEAVLQHLIHERERLLKVSDKRIASVNDRTILAVAAVIQKCAEIAALPKGSICE
jgi:integrase